MAARTKQLRSTFRVGSDAEYLAQLVTRLVKLHLNDVLSDAGIAIGTTTTKARTTATTTYKTDGEFRTKAATDDLWTLGVAGSNTAVAPSRFQKYLLCLDAAGAATVIESTQGRTANDVVMPAVPDGRCVVGVLQIATNASTTFTPGTTALNAAGVTATYTDGIGTGLLKLIAGDMNTVTDNPD